jgi:hypothetical protein
MQCAECGQRIGIRNPVRWICKKIEERVEIPLKILESAYCRESLCDQRVPPGTFQSPQLIRGAARAERQRSRIAKASAEAGVNRSRTGIDAISARNARVSLSNRFARIEQRAGRIKKYAHYWWHLQIRLQDIFLIQLAAGYLDDFDGLLLL